MIRSILAKEYRSLFPFLVLIGFLIGAGGFFVLATEFPDQYPLSNLFGDGDWTVTLVLFFFMAFALAQGLLMRERAENTLEFIDSLPASRSAIFACKFIAGFSILALWPILGNLVEFFFHIVSRTSSDPAIHLGFLVKGTLIDVTMTAVFLSIGLALSFLGRFALLAVALLWLGYDILLELKLPWVAEVDPFNLGNINMIGNELIVPWRALCVQMGIGGACLAIAYVGFLNLGAAPGRSRVWKRLATPVLIVGCVGAATAWIAYGVYLAWDEDLPEGTGAEFAAPVYVSWATSRARTASFEFIYPNNRASQAEALIDRAEAIHTAVTDFLGARPKAGLVVDLTSTQPRHAGTAYWKRIRVNLLTAEDDAELEAILGHELVHIYIDQLSENRLRDRFNSVRFFHEGLASHLEYRLFRPPARLAEIRKVAAAAHARNQLRFETLVDGGAFSAEYAGEWVYPLGESFVAAVVERFGEGAPGELVRAFARKEARTDLEAMTLWEDTFQAAGYNLEDAIAGFFEILDGEAKARQAFIDGLPALNARIDRKGDWIGITIVASGGESPPLPGRLLCRFRPAADTPEHRYTQKRADEEGTAWAPAHLFSGQMFWYQIGYRPGETMMPIFEPWRRAPVPKAGEE